MQLEHVVGVERQVEHGEVQPVIQFVAVPPREVVPEAQAVQR